MMRITTSACGALVALALLPGDARAQDIAGSLEALAIENAQLYLHPIATGFGTSLGTGFAQTAQAHQPLGFDIGVRVMGAFVPNTDRTFTPVLPTSVTYNGESYGAPYETAGTTGLSPTAAGQGSGAILAPRGSFRGAIESAGENPDDYNIQFPQGMDIPAVPFLLVQGSVGVGFGTDVILRVIPAYEFDQEVGEISAFGFGVKHSIDQWLPGLFPVRLAALMGWQRFDIGDYIDASATTMSLVASKGLGPLTVFATGGYATSTLDVSYTANNPPTAEHPNGNPGLPPHGGEYGFSYRSTKGARSAVGMGLKLLVLDLSAEYALGAYNTASVKAGISFR